MKRSSNQPSITSRFVRRKPDKLEENERRATVNSTPGVAGGPGLTRRRVVGSPGVSGVSGGSVRSRSGRGSLLESSDVKKTAYKVQKEWTKGKPSFTASNSWKMPREVTPTVVEKLPELSEEQMKIVELVCKKRANVFFTGEAGTGKSLIIKTIMQRFQDSGIMCCVTAPTGLAAVNIGGVTIYRWSGLGLMNGEAIPNAQKIAKSQEARMRWTDTKVLIIDEVSMMPTDKFKLLDQVARIVRKKDRPFGGIQLVLTGDFFQLPPVVKDNKNRGFLFNSIPFREAIAHKVQLTKVYRQQGDSTLTEMLRKLRFANPCDHDELNRFFGSLARELDDSDGIAATVLEPRNEAVLAKNQAELAKLPGPEFTVCARDTYSGNNIDDMDESRKQQCLKSLDETRVVGELKLKLGAQVMIMKNLYKDHMRLVNGNMGLVKWIMSPNKYHTIYQSDRDRSGRSRMFEALEWVENMLKKGKPAHFFPRSKDFKNMPKECPEQDSPFLSNYDAAKTFLAEIYETMEVQFRFKPNPKFDCTSVDALLPVIKFVDPTTGTRFHHISHELFVVPPNKGSNHGGMERRQLPLTLSWAMSIHKCQGQTLTKVRVDLSKAFCMGQAYVALSRVRSKDALQVIGFNPAGSKPSQEVIDFYRQFPRVDVDKEERLRKMVEELEDAEIDELF